MKVVLLYDDLPPTAREDELDVFVQADALDDAFAALGHTATRLPFTLNLADVTARLQRLQAGVAFNLVEAVGGQGRLVFLAPALLDGLNLPYTGAGTEAMFVTSSKLLTKRLLHAAGIPTPPWVTMSGPVTALPSGRYIIKLVWEEASIGLEDDAVVDVCGVSGLRGLMHERAQRLGGEVFAERYIAGREFNLSVLAGPDGPEVLPPAEIHFVGYADGRPKIVGYRAKWDSASFEYHHTPHCLDFPPADGPLLRELSRLARACWDLLGLRGYARVDFRVDQAGRPWVLELNANPCLSSDAGFVAAAQRAGLSFPDVVARILADARCDAGTILAPQELVP
jgi:D-alanine-D-alanine ligase